MATEGWVSERAKRRRKSVSETLMVGDNGNGLNRGCSRGPCPLVFLTVYESSDGNRRRAP
jgi:hypothetical protein